MKAADFAAHGLSERDMRTITGILRKYPDIRQVCFFRSRAKGTFHAGSDIDLAIMNPGVQESTVRRLQSDFEESSLPWFVDVVDFPSLKHEKLRDHIRRVGVVVYERNEEIVR